MTAEHKGRPDRGRIKLLLERYSANSILREEYDELMQYLVDAESDDDLYAAMNDIWEEMSTGAPLTTVRANIVFNKITSDPRFDLSVAQNKKAGRSPILNIAASVILISSLSIILWLLFKPADIFYKERMVSKGQRVKMTLDDGSEVWINAGSKLRYPVAFTRNTREVYLDGQAFFSIKHDKAKPFIVHTGETSTTVLGTEFDVEAYGTRRLNVTVLKGKVKVSDQDEPLDILTPNQRLEYDRQGNRARRLSVDAKQFTAWKDGELVLNDVSIAQAAELIARWYNVQVRIASPELEKCRFSVSFINGENIRQVMTVLSQLNGFNYHMEGSMVTINGQGCR